MSASVAYDELISVLNVYLTQVAPCKTIIVTKKEFFHEPWINVQLCKYYMKCKCLFRLAHEKKDENLMLKYKQYRQVLNRLKLSEKRTFYSNLFNKIGKDSRTLWSVLNSLIKKSSNKNDTIKLLEDGAKVNAPQEICNVFNRHFIEAGVKVASQTRKHTLCKL